MYAVDVVCDALVQGRLLRQSNDDPPAYLPARDIAEIPVAEVLATVRMAGEDRFLNPQSIPLAPHVEDLVEDIESASAAATKGISLRSIVDDPEAPANDRRLDSSE
jgi:membrane protein